MSEHTLQPNGNKEVKYTTNVISKIGNQNSCQSLCPSDQLVLSNAHTHHNLYLIYATETLQVYNFNGRIILNVTKLIWFCCLVGNVRRTTLCYVLRHRTTLDQGYNKPHFTNINPYDTIMVCQEIHRWLVRPTWPAYQS